MEPSDASQFQLVQLYLCTADARRDRLRALTDAWEWFLRRYRPLIVRTARGLFRFKPEDREPELWASLLPRLRKAKYEPARAPLDAYIAYLVEHAALDAARESEAKAIEPCAHSLPGDLVDPGDGPQAALEKQEDCVAVQKALDELRETDAREDVRLLERHCFEHTSLADIARETGRKPELVRFRYARARAQLKRTLLHGRRRGLLPGA